MAAGPGIERTPRHGIERRDPDERDGGEKREERPVERKQLLLEPDMRLLEPFGEKRLHRLRSLAAPAASSLLASNAVLSAGSRNRTSVMTSRTTGAAARDPPPPCSTTHAAA